MSINRDSIIKEIQRVARDKNKNQLAKSEFITETGISNWQIYQLFDGWREACELAGLDPHYQNVAIDDNALFEEMYRVFSEQPAICTRTRFGKLAKYSVDTYKKRFGQWQQVLSAFKKWIDDRGIEFPYYDDLTSSLKPRTKNTIGLKDHQSSDVRFWQGKGKTVYGSVLSFRGLQHEPINEQGVVFLFGMVCHELGFIVEAIKTGYPDCKAKRRVNKPRDLWEEVTIEFEFNSRNFKEHGHNPEHCDVIVCWKHDWLECPIEVLELSSAIKSLPPKL